MSLDTFTLKGTTHHVLTRGRPGAPVLLLVQQGPGLPMIHDAPAFERALRLEEHFRVVYWDQRGTGRSWAPDDAQPLSASALADDVAAMARALCERLKVDAIDVAGFSLGGSLAILAADRAGGAIRRVLAVGPDIDMPASERFAWDFARDEAVRRGHRRALGELERIGAPPHVSSSSFLTRVKWVTNFGGVVVGASFAGLFLRLLWRLFTSRHYSLRQAIAALRGMQQTQGRALEQLRDLSMLSLVKRVQVPVTIAQGRLDAAAPPALAQAFIDQLEAPKGKRLVWFDACAHSPHFEAPEAFRALVLETFA